MTGIILGAHEVRNRPGIGYCERTQTAAVFGKIEIEQKGAKM